MSLKTRLSQVAAKIESAEGTAETLTASEATLLPYDPSFAADIAKFARTPARSVYTPLDKVTGRQLASLGVRTELKGSGDVTTAPAWGVWAQLCGMTESVVKTVAIGAVSGGPFLPGELVSNGSDVGRVVGAVAATPLYYVLVSGSAFANTDNLTGATSGATATCSADSLDDKGFEYLTRSGGEVSGTVALFRDGRRKLMVGARGNAQVTGVLGEPLFLTLAMQGVYGSVADVALLASIAYESVVPPSFLGVDVTVQGYAAKLRNLSIDLGNELTPDEYVGSDAPKGAKSVLIIGRTPTATMDPQAVLVATHDFWGKVVSGAGGYLYTQVGSSAGNTIKVAAPRVQYDTVAEQENAGVEVDAVNMSLTTNDLAATDNALQLAMV